MAMIYLIRHGQASFLSSNYDQLSETGEQQSAILGKTLQQKNQQVSLIATGTLSRHEQTASHCLQSFGSNIEMTQDPRWNEYDHMELLSKHNPAFTDYAAIGEYLKQQENPMMVLQQVLNASILDWIENRNDYETNWVAFKQGVLDAIAELETKLEKGQTAWVFTSGGPIAAVLVHLLSLKDAQFIDLQVRLVNSSITKILVGRNGLSLSTYNEYSHLDHNPELITYR